MEVRGVWQRDLIPVFDVLNGKREISKKTCAKARGVFQGSGGVVYLMISAYGVLSLPVTSDPQRL